MLLLQGARQTKFLARCQESGGGALRNKALATPSRQFAVRKTPLITCWYIARYLAR